MFCYGVGVDIAGSERLAGASAEPVAHDPGETVGQPSGKYSPQKLDLTEEQQGKIKPVLQTLAPPEHCSEQEPVPG